MMRDAQIVELFVACKSLVRDAAFLMSDCLLLLEKWRTDLLSKEQLYDPKIIIKYRDSIQDSRLS